LKNPIDLTVESGYDEYHIALDCVLTEYDSAIVINVATPYLDSTGIARGIISAAKKHQKPIINNFMTGRIVKEAIQLLDEVNLVNLATGERGAFLLSKLSERRKIQERIQFARID
jgi:acyl-CoA synthetase (NDP forming)